MASKAVIRPIASHYGELNVLPERRVNGLTIRTVCTDCKGTFRFLHGPLTEYKLESKQNINLINTFSSFFSVGN